MPGRSNLFTYARDIEIGEAAKAELVIKLDDERARESINPTPMWGRELIVKDVPITGSN